jgi:hypothetical protein
MESNQTQYHGYSAGDEELAQYIAENMPHRPSPPSNGLRNRSSPNWVEIVESPVMYRTKSQTLKVPTKWWLSKPSLFNTIRIVMTFLFLTVSVIFLLISYADTLRCGCGNNSLQTVGASLLSAVTTYWLKTGMEEKDKAASESEKLPSLKA